MIMKKHGSPRDSSFQLSRGVQSKRKKEEEEEEEEEEVPVTLFFGRLEPRLVVGVVPFITPFFLSIFK